MDAHRVAPGLGRRRLMEHGGQRVCRCRTALPEWRAGCKSGLLSQWLLAEVAPGRLIPGVPIAFGAGIACYFAADREPHVWAVLPLAIGAVAVAFVARRRPFGFPLTVGIAGVFAGLAIATLQTARIAHPILQVTIANAAFSGFVEIWEERERSDRIVVRVERFDALGASSIPRRVRVAVRKGSAPPVGSFVELKAHLSPPMQPLRPGGYDFARDMYFQKIGASGYALGAIRVKPPPAAAGFWLIYATIVDGIRETIDDRIRAALRRRKPMATTTWTTRSLTEGAWLHASHSPDVGEKDKPCSRAGRVTSARPRLTA